MGNTMLSLHPIHEPKDGVNSPEVHVVEIWDEPGGRFDLPRSLLKAPNNVAVRPQDFFVRVIEFGKGNVESVRIGPVDRGRWSGWQSGWPSERLLCFECRSVRQPPQSLLGLQPGQVAGQGTR
jgi:hypothetical protein